MTTTTPPDDLDLWVQDLGAFFRSPIRTLGGRCVQLGLLSSKWALRALALAVVLSACLVTAAMIFTWIYFTMMPVQHVQKPVYFDFARDAPEALVSLMGNQWQYRTPSPYNLQPVLTFLTSGVPYDVDVEFTLADQVAAAQSGMLMIEASAEHAFRDRVQPVAHSKRPVEIRKRQTLIQLVRDAVMLAPAVAGLYSPSVRVRTRIFERFVDFAQFPISTMNVTLIRAPTHTGEIHLTDAVLVFNLHLSGWRYLFYTYFWTSAFVLIPLVAVSMFVVALVSYFTMKTAPPSRTTAMDETTSSDYEPLPSRSPSPRTKRVSPEPHLFESETPLKTLDDDDDDESSRSETESATVGDDLNAAPDSESVAKPVDDDDDDQKTTEDGSSSDYEHVGDDDVTVASSSLSDGKISPSS